MLENKYPAVSHTILQASDRRKHGNRLTFRDILRQEAPQNAKALETKACTASRLAKIQPRHAAQLYFVKDLAVRQLFRIPGQMPFVRNAWTTEHGFLLSIRLCKTGAFLHLPFEELTDAAQRFYGPWVRKRAYENPWQFDSATYTFRARRGR
jgi:hypothetical protein